MKLSIKIEAISTCESFQAEINRSDFPSYALALVALSLDLPDLKAKLAEEFIAAGHRPRGNSQSRKRINLKNGSLVHARLMELSQMLSLPANHIFERLCAISLKNRRLAQSSATSRGLDGTPSQLPTTAVSSRTLPPLAAQHQLQREEKPTPPLKLQSPRINEASDPDRPDYSMFPGLSL